MGIAYLFDHLISAISTHASDLGKRKHAIKKGTHSFYQVRRSRHLSPKLWTQKDMLILS
jgi:hypothetical protein